jgi:hypothetical protein
MMGAMQGSNHSLRQIIRTRRTRQRAIAGRVTARRYVSHAGEIALIHSDFAHRFHLAMKEVCITTRSAMMQRLMTEKATALARVWRLSAAEVGELRVEQKAAHDLRREFRKANCGCCTRKPIHRPVRSECSLWADLRGRHDTPR